MRYLKVWSDIHNDLGFFTAPPDPSDVETVLLLPGDLYNRVRSSASVDWLVEQSRRFGAVLVVLGNHDYWKDSLDRAVPALQDALCAKGVSNVHVLEKSTWQGSINDRPVRVLGTTLWTDFDRGDPLALWDARRVMVDYKKIRTNQHTRRLTPEHILVVHKQARAWLDKTLAQPFEGVTVVMSHHAPSRQSLDRADPLNGAYASDLEALMLEHAPHLWVHGHVHSRMSYRVGKTLVECNPRGYNNFEKDTGFEVNWRKTPNELEETYCAQENTETWPSVFGPPGP